MAVGYIRLLGGRESCCQSLGREKLLPDFRRSQILRDGFISSEHRYIEPVGIEPKNFGKELETPRNDRFLEIVTQRPGPEHFEERGVAPVAHLIDILRPDTLLNVGQACPKGTAHPGGTERADAYLPW